MRATMGVLRLNAALHDARLDLSSVRRTERGVSASGSVERLTNEPFGLRARYPFHLCFLDAADFTIEDEEGIGELIVMKVVYEPENEIVRVESAIAGRLLVRTAGNREAELEVQDEPTEVRRWLRWRSTRA